MMIKVETKLSYYYNLERLFSFISTAEVRPFIYGTIKLFSFFLLIYLELLDQIKKYLKIFL